MRIGIEARWIALQRTGFGNFAYNLLKELSSIDKKNEYLIFLNKQYLSDEIPLNSNFKMRILPGRPEFYKHILIPLDILLEKRNLDFFHFLYNAPSLMLPCPFVLTIHDVSYKYVPNMVSPKDRLSLICQLRMKAKKAIKVITVSENTKKDIVNFFDVPQENVEVIYEGVDESFKRIEDEHKKRIVAEKYGLPSKFLLYVGTYLPHKNLGTLLRAYHKLREQFSIQHSLVLAGNKGRNFSEISRLISQLDLDKDVKTIGFVPNEDLPLIYNLGDLFVFPSLYEGFGLPLLEAMACGVPVLSSNASSLPEIGGDAAMYFPPKDVHGLTKGIMEIISHPRLKNDLIEKGILRSKLFSWKAMALKTLEVYEQVYEIIHSELSQRERGHF